MFKNKYDYLADYAQVAISEVRARIKEAGSEGQRQRYMFLISSLNEVKRYAELYDDYFFMKGDMGLGLVKFIDEDYDDDALKNQIRDMEAFFFREFVLA